MFSRLRSNSQPIKPEGKVVYQGFLEKRGRLNTAFKKRWCVLKEDGKLYYYTPGDKETPQDSIILENVVVRMAYSEAFAFEIVTKDRVYHFLAPSLEERTAWLKALSAKTSLDSENSLIEKAEEMISRATYLKCKSDEEREAEQALSPRSYFSSTSILDSGSSPTSTSATSHTHLPPSHLRSFTSASHLLSSSSSASLSASLSRSHSSPVLASLDPLPSAGSSDYLPDLLYPPPSPQLQHIQQHPQHMQHVYSSTPPLHSSLSTSHTTYHPQQHPQQQHDLQEDQKEKKKETSKSKTKSFLNLGYNSSQRISRRRKGDI